MFKKNLKQILLNTVIIFFIFVIDRTSKIYIIKLAELETVTLKKYGELTEAEVKTLVLDAKWLTTLNNNIQTEIDAISQRLTGRVKELAERYENTLTQLESTTKTEEDKVKLHLQKMGLVWN